MTIFDLKPMEMNQLLKAPSYNKFTISQWNIDLSRSKYEYKSEENLSRNIKSKKRVTFADEKGQNLVNIITIERAHIPRLNALLKLENSRIISKTDDPPITVIQPHDWVTSFIQPASMYGRFKSDLIKQNIKLATAVIKKNSLSDTEYEYEMTGIIKVVNICFEKRVLVRLSTDSQWTSSKDYDAKFKNDSSDCATGSDTTFNSDEFEFQIKLPTPSNQIPMYLEFAIGMETPQGNYWDSNCDKNYRLDYCQVSSEGLLPLGLVGSTNESGQSPGPYTLDCKPNLGQFKNEYTKYRAWSHYSDEMSFY